MQFEEGKIVWLNTGSPAMSMKQLNEIDGTITCSWFVGTKHNEARFTPKQLTDKEPPQKRVGTFRMQ